MPHSAPPSRPIRVILGELPALTTEVVRSALTEAGMEVAEAATAAHALAQARHDAGDDCATVIIFPAASRATAAACAEALGATPSLHVLFAVTAKRRADVLELRLLGADVGRDGVVQAVRAAVEGSLDA